MALKQRPKPDHGESFLDDYLLYLMAQASDAASTVFHRELAAQNVSVPSWRILSSLYPDKSLNVTTLAAHCMIKQPTLTRQLDKLCEMGLTARQHENKDRRGVLVKLTPKGRKQAKKYISQAEENEARIMSGFSRSEVADLKTILKELIRRMKENNSL